MGNFPLVYIRCVPKVCRRAKNGKHVIQPVTFRGRILKHVSKRIQCRYNFLVFDHVLATRLTNCIREKYNITKKVNRKVEQHINLLIQFVVY